MQEFWSISYLFSPLLIGLTAHGFAIKFGWFSALVKPIDNEKTFRGKRIFGDNKTYRGILMTAIGTALGFGIQMFLHRFEIFRQIELLDYQSVRVISIGFFIGAAAMLSELPNSFIKRQIDIAPGATTNGIWNLFFYIFDQIDYLIGVWIVLTFYVEVTFQRIIFSVVFLFFSHQIISLLGYWLGMRKTAR
ncbi:MAG: CDP-archaeol synthase [Pyrinomonadaceae bacterium]|nr:CDP-archaeol synthase [Pyrinomonadaceae bacterium]